MAHFAVVCPDDAGHLLSVGGLGSELARRGHQVTLIGHSRSAHFAEKLNVAFYELDRDSIPWPSGWALYTAFNVFGAGWQIAMRNALLWRAEVFLQLLPPALKELQVDGLILDQIFPGAATVAEHLSLPYITICSALPWHEDSAVPPPFTHWGYSTSPHARLRNQLGFASWRWYIQPTLKSINRYRRQWKLRPLSHIDESYSRLAQLTQLFPEIDFPHERLPANFHYVGPLAAHRRWDDDGFPWDKLDGRPMIFASLGTVSDPQNADVLRRIATACNGVDAQLVMALGKWSGEADEDKAVPEKLDNLPENAIVAEYAPQLQLLEQAALLITHSGLNTTLESLTRAVPMVAVPRAVDQPGVAARVVHKGVGLRGSFYNSRPDELRHLIERVLAEPSFRERAREMQSAVAAAGGVQRAADIAEQAFTTGRPVEAERTSLP